MSRGAVNGKGQGLHGDLTTTGAVCISSLPNASQGGRGVLRLGDKTTECKQCGKTGVIVDSLPAMKWGGIATVLDGAEVRCGCPPGRNRLVAPLASAPRQMARADAAQPPEAMARPGSTTASPSPMSDQNIATRFATAPTEPSSCNHPDQMEELASYIAGEMNRNISHPSVLKMKELLSYDPTAAAEKFLALPWYSRLAGPPNFSGIALKKQIEALAIWTERVGQNRPWDHKPILQERYNGVVWHKQGKYNYYYDIWSNIHYGYVGTAAGLSEGLLLDGAGAEQIISDSVRKGLEFLTKPKHERRLLGPRPTASPWTDLRSWDDVADRVSISIGIKLHQQYPHGEITTESVMREVLSVAPDDWGDGIEDHTC